MGENPKQSFQLSFNAALKVDFQGSRVTSDGGLILVREGKIRLPPPKWIYIFNRRRAKTLIPVHLRPVGQPEICLQCLF